MKPAQLEEFLLIFSQNQTENSTLQDLIEEANTRFQMNNQKTNNT